MPYKDPEKFRTMHRVYNQTWKSRRTKCRNKLLDEKIGSKCFICLATNCLTTHKKDGKNHKPLKDMTKKEFGNLLEHPEEFVRLCRGCHRFVHWCMKLLSLSWKEIEWRLKK